MGDLAHFSTFIKTRLPQGNQIRLYHVTTNPTPCPPIFAPGPGRSEEATTVESHFLAVSRPRQQTGSSLDHSSEVIVLAIEVLIFTTTDLTTIFVSKADSTGFLERSVSAVSHRTSLAQTAITAFLEFLLKARSDRGRLVLSLFARAQNQYLFPGSIENATKHVLDDRQLIKWWCRILNPLARQAQTDGSQSVKAHVVVPGCDSGETKVFFPPSSPTDLTSDPMWVNAYPVGLLAHDTSLPPRCLVPRLPDDPKSRFLEDLDAQYDEHGNWRGIKTLDQFWEMMAYRQECSAGRLVGFVWVVFTHVTAPKRTDGDVSDEIFTHQKRRDQQNRTLDGRVAAIATSPATLTSIDSSLNTGPAARPSPIDPIPTGLTASPPIIFMDTANTTNESDVTKKTLIDTCQSQSKAGIEETTPQTPLNQTMTSSVSSPPSEIVLSSEDYQSLMDELLQLDFAGEQTAAESSEKWRVKAMQLAGVSRFGLEVDGAAVEPDAVPSTTNAISKNVNVLTGVRKKRKAAPVEMAGEEAQVEPGMVNTLATNMVRKKPKG